MSPPATIPVDDYFREVPALRSAWEVFLMTLAPEDRAALLAEFGRERDTRGDRTLSYDAFEYEGTDFFHQLWAPRHRTPEQIDQEERLHEVLRSDVLSDEERTCIWEVVGLRRSEKAVADALGMVRGSVRKHVKRGLAKLRDALQ